MPAPRDSSTSQHSSSRTPPSAAGAGSQISSRDSLAMGAWRVDEGPENEQLVQFARSPWDYHFKHCICAPSRRYPPPHQQSRRNSAQLLSKTSDETILQNSRKNIEMRQLLYDHHPRASRTVDGLDLKEHSIHTTDQRTVCVIGHSTRTKGTRGSRSTSPSSRNIFCRLSVHEENVAGAAQEHEEVICSGHYHGQRNDFHCKNTQLRRYPPER